MAGSCKSGEMTAKKCTELVRDRSQGSRSTVVDRFAMGDPQNVESHCMTGLEAVPVFPAEESGIAGRP